MLCFSNRIKHKIPEVAGALARLDQIKNKNDEGAAIYELAKAYQSLQKISKISNDVLINHIIPFIVDPEDREIHNRANMLNICLSVIDRESDKDDFLYDLHNLNHKSIWYGKQVKKKLTHLKLPDFLIYANNLDNFRFSNKECEQIIDYIKKVRDLNSNTRQLPCSDIFYKYRHEFPLRYKVMGPIMNLCESYEEFKPVMQKIMKFLFWVFIMMTMVMTVLQAIICSATGDAKICLITLYTLSGVFSSALLCILIFNLNNNTNLISREYSCYIDNKDRLGDDFDIHIMVKKLCIEIENICANNPINVHIREEDFIDMSKLIQMSGFEAEITRVEILLRRAAGDDIDLESGTSQRLRPVVRL